MADIVNFTGVTKLDLPPERILQKALDANLKEVIVIGYDQEGNEWFASSVSDGGDVVWHLERAKFKLMVIADAAQPGEFT